MSMRRTLDSDEFSVEFPSEWDTFCSFFEGDSEEARFRVDLDEDGAIVAWHQGEQVAVLDSESGQWEEAT